jgi:hypothetical protein
VRQRRAQGGGFLIGDGMVREHMGASRGDEAGSKKKGDRGEVELTEGGGKRRRRL